MAYLSWISDEKLVTAVSQILLVRTNATQKAESKFHENVIDPFSAIFEISGFNVNYKQWLVSEKRRKAQKTLQNQVGVFHQSILGSVDGWEDLEVGQGVDLVCHSKKLIAEVKNKYNTVSGGKLADQYYSLDRLVSPNASQFKGYTAYFVNIIPKKPERYDTTFEPSDKDKSKKCEENELIRIVDGATFYSMVTGEKAALEQLFNCLPSVINDLIKISLPKEDRNDLKNFFELAFGGKED